MSSVCFGVLRKSWCHTVFDKSTHRTNEAAEAADTASLSSLHAQSHCYYTDYWSQPLDVSSNVHNVYDLCQKTQVTVTNKHVKMS